MSVWLLLLGCATEPVAAPEPVLEPARAMLDGTSWACTWVAMVRARPLTVEHTWTFHEGGTVSTDLADRMREALLDRRISIEDANETMTDFLDFGAYGFPNPRIDRDFDRVAWHGVGADTLLVDFSAVGEAAEKWVVVPAGRDAMHLDRDGAEPWAIRCRSSG